MNRRIRLPLVVLMLATTLAVGQKHLFVCGDSKSTLKPWLGQLTGWDTVGTTMAWHGWHVTDLYDTVDYWLSHNVDQAKTPEVILINIGINDVPPAQNKLRIRNEFTRDYLYVLDALHAKFPAAKVYCMRVWDALNSHNYYGYIDTVDNWINAVISLRRQFVFAGPDERIWLKDDENGVPKTSDSTHYSAYGNSLCAVQWLSYINPKVPMLQSAPTTISFGNVSTRGFKDTVLTISNIGGETLRIDNVASSHASFFPRQPLVTINPGQMLGYTITFAPNGLGSVSGFLLLQTNSVILPDTVRVDGVGTRSYPEERNRIPQQYVMAQNYPNPFNPSTRIAYELPKAQNVTLLIFNTLGQQVASVVNEYKEAGYYQIEWDASHVPSGIYFYRLHAGEFVETKKMVLLR